MSAPDAPIHATHLDDATRGWLAAARFASLGTLREGHPFTSLVPFAMHGDVPVLFLSDLAVHTQGLRADPRCSLLVSDPSAADPSASWRVTLVATAHIEADPHGPARAAFLARHPSTQELPGFFVWTLAIERTRFIAGFGNMGWL
jgi:putative heme iron utilization protein